jgi:hypothetical protein
MKTINRNFFLPLFFFLLPTMGIAQENKDSLLDSAKSHLVIKFTPLSLVDPLTPALQFGVEYIPGALQNRIGLQFDYGYNLALFRDKGSWVQEDTDYHKFRSEIRGYLGKKRSRGVYLALEGFYIHQDIFLKDQGYTDIYGQDYSFDAAEVLNTVKGFALKTGNNFYFGKRWNVDFYTGFGFRYVTTKYQTQGREEANFFKIIPLDHKQEKDNFRRFHLAFNFKVGYRLM